VTGKANLARVSSAHASIVLLRSASAPVTPSSAQVAVTPAPQAADFFRVEIEQNGAPFLVFLGATAGTEAKNWVDRSERQRFYLRLKLR
jgi:hypothetical protein